MAAAGPLDLGADTAFVHDYLTQIGGAERVAGQIARWLPRAALFTSLHDATEVPEGAVGGRRWKTGFLQPLAGRVPLKLLLPLLPAAIASLDLGGHDLVLSSSSAFAHHARKGRGAVHVSLCCTPPRFLWRQRDYFLGHERQRLALAPLLAVLRRFDLRAAAGVDTYVAVSQHIAARIEAVYGRRAKVVYPPVELDRFAPSSERSGRFLVVSRLVASKRVELAVEAANRYELPLDVIGKGPELPRLRRQAGPTVRVLSWQPDVVVRRAISECIAVVVAAEEDFGLVAAEAQASSRPPVAFASGGALEVIEDGVTGYLFRQQTPESLAEAMLKARDGRLHTADLVASARRFSIENFLESLGDVLEAASHQVDAPAVVLKANAGATGLLGP